MVNNVTLKDVFQADYFIRKGEEQEQKRILEIIEEKIEFFNEEIETKRGGGVMYFIEDNINLLEELKQKIQEETNEKD